DGDAGPVEVAVVGELAAGFRDGGGQPVKRGGRLALGADERLSVRAELPGRPAQDRRVLARADELTRADSDRHRDQLVQGDVERGAVRLRRGQPLPQAVAVRRQVEDQDAAGYVIDDYAATVPQVAVL